MKCLVLALLLCSLQLLCTAKSRKTGRSKSIATRTQKGERDDIDGSDRDVFDLVAHYFSKSGKRFRDYDKVEIRRSIAKLAASQATLKTMDGATHQFVNAFKEASTLRARHAKFVSAESPKKKEAAKLYEYVTTVERSLQAAEVCQAVRNSNEVERTEWLKNAGLVELKRFVVEHNKLPCTVAVLAPIATQTPETNGSSTNSTAKSARTAATDRKTKTTPQAFAPGELVIAVVETGDCLDAVSKALRVFKSDSVVLPLKSVGFVEEEVTLQPTLLELTKQALQQCEEFLVAARPLDATVPEVTTATAAAAAAAAGEKGQAAEAAAVKAAPAGDAPPPLAASASQQRVLPTQIRLMGYSSGAAVAAYMALVLDGSLVSEHKLLKDTAPFAKLFHKSVRCYCLAPPPCVSRSIVPRFVSTVVCGDDLVPRASHASISRLKERLLKALSSGGGLGALTSWVGDVSSVASKSLQQYTGGQHDLSALCVPGRVFFCKSRSLQNGASIQRVMRGNWREDVLWLLHEILVSKKMAEHHSLEYIVKTLSRL